MLGNFGHPTGWRAPIQEHVCVLERQDTRFLRSHPNYAGEWRAVCLCCQSEQHWTYRTDADKWCSNHPAFATDSNRVQPSDMQPREAQGLSEIGARLAADCARLRERERCALAGHPHDRLGRLECTCAEVAAREAGTAEQQQPSGEQINRIQALANELLALSPIDRSPRYDLGVGWGYRLPRVEGDTQALTAAEIRRWAITYPDLTSEERDALVRDVELALSSGRGTGRVGTFETGVHLGQPFLIWEITRRTLND